MGSHLTSELLSLPELADFNVIILDDLSGGFLDNVPSDERVQFVKGSITDSELINRLFEQHSFEFVWHLAAYAAEGLSHFIRRFNSMNNLTGRVNLINAPIRHHTRRFVFTSSIAVYGSAQIPMLETTIPQPEDPYGIAKYAVELDLESAREMFGLDFTIFRPHNVYGEHQNIGDRYRNVVGIFMNRIMQKRPLPVFGSGEQMRAFSYIGDVIPAIARAPFVDAAANAVFNVGSDRPVSVNELARTVASAFGVEPDIEYLPARKEVEVAWADHSRCREVFPTEEETSLETGIGRMADWARSTGPRKSSEFTNIEVRRNLPEAWKT